MKSEYESIGDFVGAFEDDIERIAICGTSYNDIGGVARVIEQQASELRKEGYDVDIFALEGTREPPDGVSLHALGRFETSPYTEVDKLLTLGSLSALRFVRSAGQVDLIRFDHRSPVPVLDSGARGEVDTRRSVRVLVAPVRVVRRALRWIGARLGPISASSRDEELRGAWCGPYLCCERGIDSVHRGKNRT